MMAMRWFLGVTALSLVVATGGAQPVDEEADESAGAIRGAPGAASERAEEQRSLELRRAVHQAYRTAHSTRLKEVQWGRCSDDVAKTRAFVLEIVPAISSTDREERTAFTWVQRELRRGAFGDEWIYMKQNPTSDPARWDVTFYGSRTDATICAPKTVLLKCSGVSADDGPSEAQCGLPR